MIDFSNPGSIEISGRHILHIGNRGYKNLGDELILLGLLRQIQRTHRDTRHTIMCHDPVWLQGRFAQHDVDLTRCRFVAELPRGRRSWRRWGAMRGYRRIGSVDTIIVGGGEIMTEETGTGYIYWLASLRPVLLRWWHRTRLVLMGGIQPPTQWSNKQLFGRWRRHVDHVYCRSTIGVQTLRDAGWRSVSHHMDTSISAYDWQAATDDPLFSSHHVVLNLNPLARQHRDEWCDAIRALPSTDQLFFLPMTGGVHDSDRQLYDEVAAFVASLGREIVLLDWESDIDHAIRVLGSARQVICSRLHCYLLSVYLGREITVFAYQKKVRKMQHDIEQLMQHNTTQSSDVLDSLHSGA